MAPAEAARHRLVVPSGADGGGSSISIPTGVAASGGRSTSVGTSGGGGGSSSSTASILSSHMHRPTLYLARLTDFRQMDVQSALDQMKTLLSTRPHIVYKTSYYRKQTKNHWARDDPAFCALQIIFLIVASIAYSVSFREPISGAMAFMLYSIVFNWLAVGFVLASVGREIANRHLTVHQSSSHVRQTVEWLYAFDIHCNAFFPVFVLLCK